MPNRLPELSYRLAHHFPDALPFIVPFYNKLINAGFDIDEHHIKPIIRRNGLRIVTDYEGTSVSFRLHGQQRRIAAVDLAILRREVESVKSVRDYAQVDAQIDFLITELEEATPSLETEAVS